MTLKPKAQSRKKKINNRRKSRELVMKSVYRGLVNQIDITQIKKDIQDDPDFIRCVSFQRPFQGGRYNLSIRCPLGFEGFFGLWALGL